MDIPILIKWMSIGIIFSFFISKPLFAYAKTKTQISWAVTVKLISAFVFAYAKSTYFPNMNFKSLAIFCGCTARFVSDFVGGGGAHMSYFVLCYHNDWASA